MYYYVKCKMYSVNAFLEALALTFLHIQTRVLMAYKPISSAVACFGSSSIENIIIENCVIYSE